MSNNPPYISLELDEDDARWLFKTLFRNDAELGVGLIDAHSMPSTDPRASLTMRLTMECSQSEYLLDRFVKQQPDLLKSVAGYKEYLERRNKDK